MALFEADRVVDTVMEILQGEIPLYDTVIDTWMPGRRMNFLKGIRTSLPTNLIPAIEIDLEGDEINWFALRTLQDQIKLRIDVTVDNSRPEINVKLLSKLVAITVGTLTRPYNIHTQIQGTQAVIFDALTPTVSYGTANQGRLRVAQLSWWGKAIEHVPDSQFYQGEAQPPANGEYN